MPNRPKDTSRDTALSLRMPRELHERLVAAAGGRSVSEDIRRRLEASLDDAPPTAADQKTAQLLAAISKIAAEASRYFGEWHEWPDAFRAFSGGVDAALRSFKPRDDVNPARDPDADSAELLKLIFEDNAEPEMFGRMLAGSALAPGEERKP